MYDKYVSINKDFKSSINLQFDLGDKDKILQYIPTTDLCDVIKEYIKSVLGKGIFKSTFLAGPYGKGKSYLMLIIAYLLSKREDRKLFKQIVKKIQIIDEELASLINELDKNKISLLPIIMNNNNSDDLNQNFMLALNNALKENEIYDIVPESVYLEALSLINQWENERNNDFDIVSECLKKIKINLAEMKIGLENYNLQAYEKFKELFSCISHGYTFNPLIGNDISLIYEDVARKIKKYGYNGLFVIFDEFGVFLENQVADFNVRLNKIQNFAEKCNNNSVVNQLHICCITHKDILLYQKNKSFVDDFKKISGRFKQIRFDRSLEENYQIIYAAIEKKVEYKQLLKEAEKEYKIFLDKITGLGIFDNKKSVNFAFDNGFPFNPLSLYALIAISEKIGQNERTLFTFISEYDLYSFRGFITNKESGLLNLDYIYDYFKWIIKESEEYRDLFYKVELLMKKSLKEETHAIFKTIALIKIINDVLKFNCTIENIALSLCENTNNIKRMINDLIAQNLLKSNINDGTIDFVILADKETNDLLSNIINTKYSSKPLSEFLEGFDKNRYYVSNKYNFEYSMVRYYYSIYIETSKLKLLKNLSMLFDDRVCDGLIVNLIQDEKITQKEIKAILANNSNKNIIIRFNNKKIDSSAIEKLKNVFVAKELSLKTKDLSEITINALLALIEDTSLELIHYLKNYFNDSYCYNKVCECKNTQIQECIYISLTETFNRTIKINNEQINKNEISSVTAKARNAVVDSLLRQDNFDFGKTSAEATINTSFQNSLKNNDSIINEINEIILGSSGKKISVTQLINKLKLAPYGMRNGVIPLFIAEAVARISIKNKRSVETIILYNESAEVEVNSQSITKLTINPEKYYIKYKQINKAKVEAINELSKLFNCMNSEFLSTKVSNLVKSIRKYITNLHPIIVKTNDKDNILQLSEYAIKFKDLFLRYDINANDILFEDLPKLFNIRFEGIVNKITEIQEEYKIRFEDLLQNTIDKVKSIFIFADESIKTSYDLWKRKHKSINSIIFDGVSKDIFNALEKTQYNDKDAINNLSFVIIQYTLSDWNMKRCEDFYKALNNFKNEVVNYKPNNKIDKKDLLINCEKNEFSKLGNTLYTNLQDVIAEYGESLSNEEKAQIMKKILDNILN